MTQDEQTILMIKGAISEWPPELRAQFESLAENLRRLLKDAGNPVGPLALALVGSEIQAKLEAAP